MPSRWASKLGGASAGIMKFSISPYFGASSAIAGAAAARATPKTLDDLLSDEVVAPVLRSAGYEPDEFREMMTEMARNLRSVPLELLEQ